MNGVISTRSRLTTTVPGVNRISMELFNSLMVIKGNLEYAKRCAKKCCYVVRDDGSLERLQKPVVVCCTMPGKDVADLAKNMNGVLLNMKEELTSLYQRAVNVARKRYVYGRGEIKSGTCRYAVWLFTKNKEFRERFDSGEYGLITDGCPELNGKDKVFNYILVKLSPDKNYRLATSCNWVFEQYAEYVRNFPGLSVSQVNNFFKTDTNSEKHRKGLFA